MSDDNLLPFSFPAVQRKKITAAFAGGRITSDGGVMLLAQAEPRSGIAERLAQVIPDRRDQNRVTQSVHGVGDHPHLVAVEPCRLPTLSNQMWRFKLFCVPEKA